ncbi:MAG: 50S ribosomal protein L18 [Parcubacteria group bacterium]|nr:50S ribosomal protein L18 [Parcubacteria group bacterium]
MKTAHKTSDKTVARKRRQKRVRAQISGTATRPRLTVFRSNTAIRAQLIDDAKGVTLVSVDSKKIDGKDAGERSGNVAKAFNVGREIAKLAKTKKVETIVFDRAGYAYHGQVKAVADGAREGGLTF